MEESNDAYSVLSQPEQVTKRREKGQKTSSSKALQSAAKAHDKVEFSGSKMKAYQQS